MRNMIKYCKSSGKKWLKHNINIIKTQIKGGGERRVY